MQNFCIPTQVGMILTFYIVILPACQCLSEKHSRQYGYNHCSGKTASLGVRPARHKPNTERCRLFRVTVYYIAGDASLTGIGRRAYGGQATTGILLNSNVYCKNK